ncbi:MAG: hypothetical protein NC040_02950 [Muribaculaceae bacterium]|nr:hypothetical protein [Muribaculaceae bacterium]
MKKLSALLICLFMLTSCGKAEIILGATETFLEEYMSHTDYPVVTYEIENIVDGKYTVVYKLRTGFPDTIVDVKVKQFGDVIYKHSTDWKGTIDIPEDTSTWNNSETLPEKIVYLFEYDGGNVYYIQNNTPSSYGRTIVYKPLWFVVYDGENVPDFMDNNNSICINNIDNRVTGNPELWSKKFESASEFLQENMTEQEIIDIFDKCGYDDQYILEIYRYSGKD